MSRSVLVVIAILVVALFAVVWMTSGDVDTSSTPGNRFEVPTPGGDRAVPVERQNPG